MKGNGKERKKGAGDLVGMIIAAFTVMKFPRKGRVEAIRHKLHP